MAAFLNNPGILGPPILLIAMPLHYNAGHLNTRGFKPSKTKGTLLILLVVVDNGIVGFVISAILMLMLSSILNAL